MPPVGPDQGRLANQAIDRMRAELITRLVEPAGERWKAVWRQSGIPVDRERYR
jgi:hypothetical protein